MNLYILRHAIAEDKDDTVYPDDGRRPLSKAGRKKMVKITRGIKKLGIEPDLILSSPHLRARETAEILVKGLDLKKKQVVYSDHLSPYGNTEALIAEINDQHSVANLVLVGHDPDLNELVSMLVSGSQSAAIIIKKGGLCCLSVAELSFAKCAELAWLLTPAMLVAFSGRRSKLDLKPIAPKNVEESIIIQEEAASMPSEEAELEYVPIQDEAESMPVEEVDTEYVPFQAEAESGPPSDSSHATPPRRHGRTSSRSARSAAQEQPATTDEPHEVTELSLSSEEAEVSPLKPEEPILPDEEEAP